MSPTNGLTSQDLMPELRLGTTDVESDYLQYKIEICSVSDCSVVTTTIDQSSSQTGWQSQNLQSSTAYSGNSTTITQYAIHQVQSALSGSTQYWWRGYAKDPAGLDTWSSASSIWTFTTGVAPPSDVQINGGTTIRGGTSLN